MSYNMAFVNEAELEDEVLDGSVEADESLVYTGASSLNKFGADFDVSELARLLNLKDTVIPRFKPDKTVSPTVEGLRRHEDGHRLAWRNSSMPALSAAISAPVEPR
jgi:hypothetical protein